MPWGVGIMEYWNTGFGGMISIFIWLHSRSIQIPCPKGEMGGISLSLADFAFRDQGSTALIGR
jgi:hypothetical protein